jgi:TPR repeat protein
LGGDQLLVNIGVAEAENALGTAFREGRGVDVNRKKAAEWFVKSANHGCLQGMNNLAMCFQNSDGIQEDLKSAALWLERAANAGLAEAQFNFANALVNGYGVEINHPRARSYFKLAANQGVPGALKGLQQLERSTGSGVEQWSSSSEDGQLIERCRKNDPQALFLLASNYENGEGGFSEDWKKSEHFFLKAFKAKHPQAALSLASFYQKKLKNPPRAFEFFLKAAEAGNPEAQVQLAKIYAFGHGCARDPEQARRQFKRAEGRGQLKQDTIDNWVKLGKDLCSFESSKSLNSNDKTIQERLDRMMKGADTGISPEVEATMSRLFSMATGDQKLTPFSRPYEAPTMPSFDEIIKRANTGSITAQRFLKGK